MTDMRADYDSKANAISITLAPVDRAERADHVHERAIVALHGSALAVPDRVVVLDVLAPAA